MYKATASSQQFLNREAMHSTKGSRKGFDLLDHGECPISQLTPEQQRQSLVSAWKQLTHKMSFMVKADPRRIELGQQIQELQNEIHKIRPKIRGHQSVNSFFIEVAKRRLPKAVYQIIMDEASALSEDSH